MAPDCISSLIFSHPCPSLSVTPYSVSCCLLSPSLRSHQPHLYSLLKSGFLKHTMFSTSGSNVIFILLPPCVVNIKSQHTCHFPPRILLSLCIYTCSLLILTFYSTYNIMLELPVNHHLPDSIESSTRAKGHVCQ